MRFPFVSRRRYDDDLDAARAEASRLREQRDTARRDEETARFNRERILRQYTALDEKHTAVCLVNERLTDDLTALKEELAATRALLTDSAATRFQAEARREKKRADRLQKQYDDAVGLKPNGIVDSRPWQPGYKADAS